MRDAAHEMQVEPISPYISYIEKVIERDIEAKQPNIKPETKIMVRNKIMKQMEKKYTSKLPKVEEFITPQRNFTGAFLPEAKHSTLQSNLNFSEKAFSVANPSILNRPMEEEKA